MRHIGAAIPARWISAFVAKIFADAQFFPARRLPRRVFAYAWVPGRAYNFALTRLAGAESVRSSIFFWDRSLLQALTHTPDSPARAAIFDLGGVVVEWNPRSVVERFTANPELREKLLSGVFGHPDWAALDRGSLNEATAIARMQTRLPLPRKECERLMRLADDSLRPIPGTLALLDALRARGLPLFVLSNMPSARFAMLRARHDFWDRFEGFVISGDIGLLKPEPAIFQHALRTFGLAASTTIFVDDHPANVAAAESLGLRGHLFRDAVHCSASIADWLKQS